MTKANRLVPFQKFGLMDRKGAVVVPAEYDEILTGEYFNFGKRNGIWVGVAGTTGEYSDVKIFGRVLWFKSFGNWGAKYVTGEILVRPRFSSIEQMGISPVLECSERGYLEYFDAFVGSQIAYAAGVTKIYEFEMGYAMVEAKNEAGESGFLIMDEKNACFVSKFFDDRQSCMDLLEEFRNDYVWSKNSIT